MCSVIIQKNGNTVLTSFKTHKVILKFKILKLSVKRQKQKAIEIKALQRQISQITASLHQSHLVATPRYYQYIRMLKYTAALFHCYR